MFVQAVSEPEDQSGTDCMRRLVNSFRARLEVNSFTPDTLEGSETLARQNNGKKTAGVIILSGQ